MHIRTICILGGTGFVGRHLAEHLHRAGYHSRILTRHRERHRELGIIPNVSLVECNIHDPSDLARHFQGCEAIINLVGLLNEGRGEASSFQNCHVDLVRKIIDAARAQDIKRYLHMSALNADAGITHGEYLRSKGEGETLAHEAGKASIAVTSFRPSVIFGPDDSFFNRFAVLLKLSPLIFPLACPNTRFAPVYVEDIAAAMVGALNNRNTFDQHIELCGPNIYTLQQLVKFTAASMGLKKQIICLPDMASRLQARVLQWVPGKPFTLDNYYSLQHDSICRHKNWDLPNMAPTPVEAVMSLHLGRAFQRTRYQRLRQAARRRPDHKH